MARNARIEIEIDGDAIDADARYLAELSRDVTVHRHLLTRADQDLLAELRAENLQDLAKVLERIRLLKGISNTETSIHLETYRLS